MELPYSGRAIIDENFDGIAITIPTKKNWAIVLFLGFWLFAWCFGEFFAIRELTGGGSGAPDLFLFVWLGGWTIGGFFAFRALCWMVIGKEIITIGQGALTIDKRGALFYRSKTYDLREAKNFRAIEDRASLGVFGSRRGSIYNLDKNGTIRFDYGMQTIKFGDGLDEAEANFILQKLRNKKLID